MGIPCPTATLLSFLRNVPALGLLQLFVLYGDKLACAVGSQARAALDLISLMGVGNFYCVIMHTAQRIVEYL